MSTRYNLPVVAALVGLLFATPARAQDGGLIAGVNFSNVTIDDPQHGNEPETGYKPGLALGTFVWWPLHRYVGLQAEVLYSQKWFSVNENDGTQDEEWDWIEIPILGRIGPTGDDWYALAGPAFSYLTRAKTEIDGRHEDIKDAIEKWDVSIVVGGGYRIGRHYGFEAQWDQGIRNINKTLGGDRDNDFTVKTKAFRVNFTWMP